MNPELVSPVDIEQPASQPEVNNPLADAETGDAPVAFAEFSPARCTAEETTQPPSIGGAPVPAERLAPELGGSIERLSEGVSKLTERIDHLERTVEYFAGRDEQHNRIVNDLSDELQQHRFGLLRRLLEPIVMELITLCDDYGKLAARHAAKRDDLVSQAKAEQIAEFRDEVLEILSQHGFEHYVVPDSRFDPAQQTAVNSVETSDETLAGTVAARRRCGFLFDGQIVRSEQVVVYKFVPSAPIATPEAAVPTVQLPSEAVSSSMS